MNFLGIASYFNKGLFSLLWQIFRFVSDIYNFLMKMASLTFDKAVIDNIINTLYLAVGVFMMFRIVVSMLQYLVDPDKLTDKSVGGGKIAVRVIISIVLFLTLNSLIFPFLSRIQNAVVGENGLLYKVLEKATTNENGDSIIDETTGFTSYLETKDNNGSKVGFLNSIVNFFVPEVKAAECLSSYKTSYSKASDAYTEITYTNFSGCSINDKSKVESYIINNFLDIRNMTGTTTTENRKYSNLLVRSKGTYGGVSHAKVNENNLKLIKQRKCTSDVDKNCYTITTLTDSNTDYADGALKDIYFKATRTDGNDSQYENMRVDVIVTYINNSIYGKDCYYAYVGDSSNSGKKVDGSYSSAPFLTYMKVRFFVVYDGSHGYNYVTVRYEEAEKNVIKDTDGIRSASSGYILPLDKLNSKIEELKNSNDGSDDTQKKLNELGALYGKMSNYLTSKGYNDSFYALSAYINSYDGSAAYKDSSSDAERNGKKMGEINIKGSKDSIIKDFNSGVCPHLIYTKTGEDLKCELNSGSKVYGTDNYKNAPQYSCWIESRDTLQFVSQSAGKETTTSPRFTCPSSSFDDMVNCARGLQDAAVTENSAFNVLEKDYASKINKKRVEDVLADKEVEKMLSEADLVINQDDIDAAIDKQESLWDEETKKWNEDRSGVSSNDKFAGMLLSAFIEKYKTNEDIETCTQSDKILRGSASKSCMEILYEADDNGDIYVSAFIGIVIGIIIIALLLVLCVDIVVRHAKLILLQIISPVAVMSFINPKDKVFPQWVKMYGATFADLFIKLLAISLIPILLSIFHINDQPFLVKIFLVLGILTFAKAAPSFISKVFGISDMAGSFKDAGKMLKTAAFTAAGTGLALGSAGIGVGRNVMAAKAGGLGAKGMLTAGLRGTAGIFGAGLRGAGGGMKGNVMAGAKGAWATAGSRSALYQQGVGTGAQMIGGIGLLNYADHVDRKNAELENQNKELEEFNKHKKNMEAAADSSSFMKTIRDNMNTGKINMTDDQYKAIREKYMNRAMQGGDLNRGDLNKIMSDVSAPGGRILTDDQLVDIGLLSSVDASGVSKVKEDGGLRAALNNELTMAKNDVKGSKLLETMIGANDLSDFTKLKDFSKDTKAKQESNNVAISATHNDRYRNADKVRKAKNGGK